MPINQRCWCSSSLLVFFCCPSLFFTTLLRSFPAINKNIGFASYQTQPMKSAKKFQFHAIIIEMLCFDFPSLAHIALVIFCPTLFLMYEHHWLANFMRKKPLNSITQNRWWHHIEAQLCFEIDSMWDFQETSTFSKSYSNFPRNTDTNCNYTYFTVYCYCSQFYVSHFSKYDSKWVSNLN